MDPPREVLLIVAVWDPHRASRSRGAFGACASCGRVRAWRARVSRCAERTADDGPPACVPRRSGRTLRTTRPPACLCPRMCASSAASDGGCTSRSTRPPACLWPRVCGFECAASGGARPYLAIDTAPGLPVASCSGLACVPRVRCVWWGGGRTSRSTRPRPGVASRALRRAGTLGWIETMAPGLVASRALRRAGRLTRPRSVKRGADHARASHERLCVRGMAIHATRNVLPFKTPRGARR